MNIYLDEFLPKISTEFLIKSRWNMGKYLDLVSMVEKKMSATYHLRWWLFVVVDCSSLSSDSTSIFDVF